MTVDAHERATSVWYRVAGLLRRKELAIEMIEAEIRSAQHEVLLEQATSTEIITHLRDFVALLEAVKLVLSGDPVEIARQLRERAERTIRPKS